MNTTDENQRLSFGGNGASDFFEIFGLSARQLEGYKEADRILSLARDISSVYIWILCAVGVPGNILTIITILTMQAVSPATFFIALLAALDGTSLIAKLFGQQMVRNSVYIGTFGCKFEFLVIYKATLANWVLIFICAERFFTVCYLAKKPLICTMKNSYLAVGVLAVVLFAVFAGISCPMRAANYTGRRCGTYNEYRWFWINVWYWINASLYLFIPFLCIIPMTVLMIRTLHISNRKRTVRREEEPESETEASIPEKPCVTETELAVNEGGFTLMIILAVVFFILLCLPACIFYLSYRYSGDKLVEAQWALFEQIQFFLADSTHAINFFLYFFSATTFRAQVFKLFLCQPCRKTSYAPDQRNA